VVLQNVAIQIQKGKDEEKEKKKKHKRKPLWPEQTIAMDLGEVTVA
jgi:hypothetical protein